jgi:ribosomal protein L31E
MVTKKEDDRSLKIIELVREFCAKKLDEEYFELSEKLTQKLMRKRSKPLDS